MITQAVLDAARVILQAAYTAAGSTCEVLSEWPDALYDPMHPVLVLAEGVEYDAARGNGGTQRGSPDQATMFDQLVGYYSAPNATESGSTITAAQQQMRADKRVLPVIFKRPSVVDGHDGLTLDGTCMEAGRVIKFDPQRGGPYDMGPSRDENRFAFTVSISVRASNW